MDCHRFFVLPWHFTPIRCCLMLCSESAKQLTLEFNSTPSSLSFFWTASSAAEALTYWRTLHLPQGQGWAGPSGNLRKELWLVVTWGTYCTPMLLWNELSPTFTFSKVCHFPPAFLFVLFFWGVSTYGENSKLAAFVFVVIYVPCSYCLSK